MSEAAAERASEGDRPVFGAGQNLIWGGLLAGAAGLGLTALRATTELRTALFSYLVAFAYWLGLTLGALLLLMIWRASKARWSVVLRRLVEVMAATVAVFPLLFLPIALGIHELYPWAQPTEGLEEEVARLIHHREPFLNPTFFLIRAALYFAVWIGASRLFLGWSSRQDASGAAELTKKAWRLGAGGLPAVGLTLTFAAIDWLMSLGTQWFSSMWGVYYFAGSFVGAIAMLIVATVFCERTPSLSGAVRPAHWLSLGKLLLAFTCFWAYISFSQYLLVWIANLPDTIPWLLLRQRHGWSSVGVVLIVGHFAVPFFLLLSRGRKMDSARLAPVALWILLMHYLDLYWVVMPQVRPDKVLLDWSNVTAFVGVGGVAVACGVWLLRGRHALPVRDPFLADSLGYEKT